MSTLPASWTIDKTVDHVAAKAIRLMSHDNAEQFLMDLDMSYPGLMEDCESCGCIHPRWFGGDCRNDNFRF